MSESKERTVKYSRAYIVILLAILIVMCGILIAKNVEASNQAYEGKKILVLGDSIWDLERGDSGVATILERKLGAIIYNCAIKGTSASVSDDGNGEYDDLSVGNIVNYLLAKEDESDTSVVRQKLASTEALTMLDACDVTELDTVIFAYGLNDYFAGRRVKNRNDYFDTCTYSGALCAAARAIREVNPDIQIIVVSPTYCQGYSYGQVEYESTHYSFGGGILPEYADAAEAVAASFDGLFVNQYEELGINIHNGPKYLVDATHLSEKGRAKYAENLVLHMKRFAK